VRSIWQLGNHRVLCGSSLEDESYRALFDGRRASAAFSDPPFNVKIGGHVSGNGRIRHKEFAMASGEMTEAEFEEFLHKCLELTRRGRHRNNVQLGKFGRNRTNVWQYPNASTFSKTGDEGNLLALHPTVKPVAMVADAILDCTKRGDIVLDAFLGSGTTLMAAERVGRVCYGIELEPRYVDVASTLAASDG
jgi:DNA methylase